MEKTEAVKELKKYVKNTKKKEAEKKGVEFTKALRCAETTS